MTSHRRVRLAISAALVACAVASVTGCATAASTAPGTTTTDTTTTTAPTRASTVTVFAAASLRDAFEEIGAQHTAATGVAVRFSFDGSATLVDQLAGGARADVLATADETTMTRATDSGVVAGEPTAFAENVLTLVVPPDNPAGITGLDASLAGTRLVVCAPEVPCGRATQALAERAGVTLQPVSEETSVTAVLSTVTTGEADAGVVYVTDAQAAGDAVHSIVIAGSDEVVNRYPIVLVGGSDASPEAAAFVDRVLGAPGRTILAEYGFRTP